MSKRVLIVSPHFPPVNAPDMQRVRASLPYFIEAGWEVTVLTVDDPTPTARVEQELLSTIPAAVKVERAHCFSRNWTGRIGFGNVALRALPFLFLRGCRLLSAKRYDVVYFSTTMFIVLPFGRIWKALYGVPYVIDLQDPWVTDYYERPGAPRPPGGWKYKFSRASGIALEGWTMRALDHLIVVSASYADTLRARYREMKNTSATELAFGYPESDLNHVRERMTDRAKLLPSAGLRLAFAGALGPGMLTSVEMLFAAMAKLRQQGIDVSAHFFGTSYVHASEARAVTLEIAARHGLQDHVSEQPSRLSYLDSLQVTLEADINLLFGSADLAFTPSKVFTVLAAKRPVISIAPQGSALVGRLKNLGQDCVTFNSAAENHASVNLIAEQIAAIGSGHFKPVDLSLLARQSAREIAQRQLEIFETVSENN